MGITDWFKPKEVQEYSVADHAVAKDKDEGEKKVKEIKPPMPPGQVPKESTQEINNTQLAEGLQEIYDTMQQNFEAIYLLIKGDTPQEAVVLDKEELKYIPEEKKAEYMKYKKENPEMAKELLLAYKSVK